MLSESQQGNLWNQHPEERKEVDPACGAALLPEAIANLKETTEWQKSKAGVRHFPRAR